MRLVGFNFHCIFSFVLIFNEAFGLLFFLLFFIPVLTVIMRTRWLEVQVPLNEQGGLLWTEASSTEAPFTCSAPTANSSLLRPAKLHHNQLVAIFNYNTWAALTRQPQRRKPAGARGERRGGLAGTFGQELARVKGNKRCFINLLQCGFRFPLCGNCNLVNLRGAAGACAGIMFSLKWTLLCFFHYLGMSCLYLEQPRIT